MAIILALPNLFDRVSARFVAEATPVQNFFGWKEREKNKTVGNRICWVPGNEAGDLGEIAPARYPGQNPRPLANLDELFVCYIGAFDIAEAESDRAQYIANRMIFDAWYRAVYREAHGTFAMVQGAWTLTQKTRAHGRELAIVCTIQATIPDDTNDVIPVDTQGRITTSLGDVSELTLEPVTP